MYKNYKCDGVASAADAEDRCDAGLRVCVRQSLMNVRPTPTDVVTSASTHWAVSSVSAASATNSTRTVDSAKAS